MTGRSLSGIYCALLLAIVMIVSPATCCAGSCSLKMLGNQAKENLHGYIEQRSGFRTHDDPYEKPVSLEELRLQIETTAQTDDLTIKLKGDIWDDRVLECVSQYS
jgi:hypothetical protein